MEQGESISITISAAHRAALEGAVAQGRYTSLEEALADALSAWHERQAAELARLRAAVAEGLASGPPVAFEPDAIRARLFGQGR
jgi:putative addiction module CopG family antidote